MFQVEFVQLLLGLSEDFRIYHFPLKFHWLSPGTERQ
jgi:hypothetical protein